MKILAKEVTKKFSPPQKKIPQRTALRKPLQASGNFQK
jgi:hypothetical protein